jgi:pimeloyl-ACP methyl ester carboxylesterase
MMPFSPLRIWFGGILSWAILIGGCYCIWKWANDGSQQVRTVQTTVATDDTNDAVDRPVVTPARQEVVVTQRARNHWLLALGVGLLAWSTVGFLPAKLLLGKPGGSFKKTSPARESCFIDRPDGTQLHVEVRGRHDGPTLVFTHGWSLESTIWTQVVDLLGSRFRIVVWDLPGLGRSKGPANGDYRIEKMAGDLNAVVQEFGGRGPVVLIGHSIGGMITQTFCRLYPKQLGPRVGGLVLQHTTYTNPLRTALFAPLWTAIEKPILVPLNYLTIWLAPLAWLSNWQSYWNGSLHVMTRIASFSGRQSAGQLDYAAWLAAKAWPAVISRGNLAMVTFDEQRTLPEIEIPVLVIEGKHDRMTKPEASERIESLLPHGALGSIASNHLGFWEQPREVAELIGEFAERFQSEAVAEAKLGVKAAD